MAKRKKNDCLKRVISASNKGTRENPYLLWHWNNCFRINDKNIISPTTNWLASYVKSYRYKKKIKQKLSRGE